jgi:hypothetical protein
LDGQVRLSLRTSGRQVSGFLSGSDPIGGFFDVPKKTSGFLTYHGFLTIASSSRIISRDYYYLMNILSELFGETLLKNCKKYFKNLEN